MTKKHHLIASAPIAIAAMAAFHTTPAAAQDAPQIVFDVPASEAAASPDPVIIAEPATPPVVIDIPEVESELVETATTEPETTEPAASMPGAAPTASAEPATQAAPGPAQVSTADAAEEPSGPVAIAAGSPLIEPPQGIADEPGATVPVPPVSDEAGAAPVTDNSRNALLAALLGIGGIGLFGFLILRLRRRRRATGVPTIERPVVTRKSALDREPQVPVLDAKPEHTVPDEPARPAVAAAGSDNAIDLPPTLPASRAERGRLLQRMIAANPDRANPFVSHKARAKRARLILQSIGTRFTNRKPGIDLSQYTHIWPELRGWRPATA